MRNLFGLIVSFSFIILVIVSAKLFEKAGKEASRKYIHIVLSNWWIIAMIFFDSPVWAAIGPVVFVFVNYASYKFNLIKSMERDEEEKDGLGTVYYALSLLILVIALFGPLVNYKEVWGPTIGLAGIAVMGYGDALAAIVGKISKKSILYNNYNYKDFSWFCCNVCNNIYNTFWFFSIYRYCKLVF